MIGVEEDRGLPVTVRFVCESCGSLIEEMELEQSGLDSMELSFLTTEEQADIIEEDRENNLVVVASLCEGCIDSLLEDPEEE
jgi:hypothetical protein